jgi:hypothetical protein
MTPNCAVGARQRGAMDRIDAWGSTLLLSEELLRGHAQAITARPSIIAAKTHRGTGFSERNLDEGILPATFEARIIAFASDDRTS